MWRDNYLAIRLSLGEPWIFLCTACAYTGKKVFDYVPGFFPTIEPLPAPLEMSDKFVADVNRNKIILHPLAVLRSIDQQRRRAAVGKTKGAGPDLMGRLAENVDSGTHSRRAQPRSARTQARRIKPRVSHVSTKSLARLVSRSGSARRRQVTVLPQFIRKRYGGSTGRRESFPSSTEETKHRSE